MIIWHTCHLGPAETPGQQLQSTKVPWAIGVRGTERESHHWLISRLRFLLQFLKLFFLKTETSALLSS